jgi:hypothetical protein
MSFSDVSRVFVQYRYRNAVMAQLLDLAFVKGRPIAVVSWVVKNGVRTPGDYAELEPELLRPAASLGTFWYDGIAESKRWNCPADADCLKP